MTELAKTFDPAAIEARWYAHWESTNAFRPDRPNDPPFTIVMPPPNVTGSLHIGHALDVTLQDILVRHARLQGKDALWVAGTDHAGIATQMVVERQMAAAQDKRTNYSRDDFVQKVWDWKAESGGTITRQLRRLGASCDWANERFTMDEGFSKAVLKVFVDLYNQGLLYRAKRLVNWDPALKTAISDLEVETREVQGKFWHFKYPLADGSGHISVATTRPETMLADMAVAVNPGDERYTALIGKQVRLPITGRLIPIVADDHADPELGSGAVKITPGHDFNDFEVGKRAGFAAGDMLNMLDAEAKLVQTTDGLIPDHLLGLTVKDARTAVVALLEADGTMERVEDRTIQTPYGDRSGVVIEPWLTDQWYVDAKTLAQPAIEAVRSGAIKVVPQAWEKTWFQWLENIQPWCVSRQLWWGHRIPAWYGPKKTVGESEGKSWEIRGFGASTTQMPFPSSTQIFVAATDEEVKKNAGEFYGVNASEIYLFDDFANLTSHENANPGSVSLFRDNDVLDTWFSSALWPFGTLGWPGAELNPPRNGEGDHEVVEGLLSTDASSQAESDPTVTPSARHLPVPGRNDLLAKHYPNDILISGFDILFFWDARMAMQGLHFMRDEDGKGIAPWKTLYLHGLVRAPDGSKMSKSKGNTVDPLGLIDQYGADALRFTLAAMESQGRDIKLDEQRVIGYRNFATKLWNAARFLQGNGVGASASVAAPDAELAVNKWIIGEVVETLAKLDQAIADLRYDAMADAIYHFAWGTFCDWYIELVKPVSSAVERGAFDDETRSVAGWAFDQILVMLHPFMPFITEELWHAMGERGNDIIHAAWPVPGHVKTITAVIDGEAVDTAVEFDWLIKTIIAVRSAKNEAGIPPGQRLSAYLEDVTSSLWKRLPDASSMFERVGRIEINSAGLSATGSVLRIGVPGATLVVPLEGVIDLDAERARLTKSAEAAEKEAASLAGRLNNPSFVERAKPEAVEKARADHAEKSAEGERLRAALARLG